jgi:RecB family exonuclease
MRLSYSSFDTYQTCPLKYKYRHVDHIAEPKSKEAVFGTLIHSALRYAHAAPLLPPSLEETLNFFATNWNSEMYEDEIEERAAFAQGVQILQRYYAENDISAARVIDLESRFSLEIGDEESGRHTVSGIIDRIDKTENGYEIIDYKTARKMPSQEKVDQDVQLSIYLRAFLDRYPKEIDNLENITVSLYYVKHGVKLSSTRTREQLEDIESTFLRVIEDIEAERFEPILSALCDWCGYQKICPLWKHKFKETRKILSEEAERAIDEFLSLREEMRRDKKRLAELQAVLLAYMEEEEVERVFGERGIVGKSIRSTYAYDPEALRAVLEPLDKWDDVVKVDGIALRKILQSLPAPVRHRIEELKTLDRQSTTLTVKKLGPDLELDESVHE